MHSDSFPRLHLVRCPSLHRTAFCSFSWFILWPLPCIQRKKKNMWPLHVLLLRWHQIQPSLSCCHPRTVHQCHPSLVLSPVLPLCMPNWPASCPQHRASLRDLSSLCAMSVGHSTLRQITGNLECYKRLECLKEAWWGGCVMLLWETTQWVRNWEADMGLRVLMKWWKQENCIGMGLWRKRMRMADWNVECQRIDQRKYEIMFWGRT